MGFTPGKPVTNANLGDISGTSLDYDSLTLSPTIGAGASQQVIFLPNGYGVWVDNVGTGASANRWWFDTPDGSQVVIGPRSGSASITDLRLRTNATTASAANAFIDSSTYQIRRSTSSRRYKVNIVDERSDLDAFRQLRPVRFQDRGQHEELGDAAPWYIGLIAEEVDELGLTELVAYQETEDGGVRPDAVQYDRLTIGLLQLARAQQGQLDALATRLEQLEQIVAALRPEETP